VHFLGHPQPKESQVKRFDYYDQNPWKMPKWVGALLGGIFTVVAVGALVLIVHLTRPAHASVLTPDTVAQAQAAPVGVETPPPPATSTAPAQVAVAPARVAKAHKGAKASRLASRPQPKMSHDKTAAILAKHDSHAKRKAKDDLDRMLGL
jgi:hypothetical protein